MNSSPASRPHQPNSWVLCTFLKQRTLHTAFPSPKHTNRQKKYVSVSDEHPEQLWDHIYSVGRTMRGEGLFEEARQCFELCLKSPGLTFAPLDLGLAMVPKYEVPSDNKFVALPSVGRLPEGPAHDPPGRYEPSSRTTHSSMSLRVTLIYSPAPERWSLLSGRTFPTSFPSSLQLPRTDRVSHCTVVEEDVLQPGLANVTRTGPPSR